MPYAHRLSVFTSPLAGEVDRRSVSEGGREGGKLHIAHLQFTPLPNPPPQGGRESETGASLT